PVMPFALYTFICPGHHPLLYKRSGVPQATLAQLQLELSEPSRQMVLAVLVALHGRGVSALQIDRASAHKPFFHPTGVEKLAALARISVPARPPRPPTAADAYLLRKPVARGAPPPCGRFPDGTALYVILGNPAAAHPRYACSGMQLP